MLFYLSCLWARPLTSRSRPKKKILQGKLEEGTDVLFYLSCSAGNFVAHNVKRFFKMKEPEKMPERMKRQQVWCKKKIFLFSLRRF